MLKQVQHDRRTVNTGRCGGVPRREGSDQRSGRAGGDFPLMRSYYGTEIIQYYGTQNGRV